METNGTISENQTIYLNYINDILARLKEEVHKKRRADEIDGNLIRKKTAVCKKLKQDQNRRVSVESHKIQSIKSLIDQFQTNLIKRSSNKLFRKPKKSLGKQKNAPSKTIGTNGLIDDRSVKVTTSSNKTYAAPTNGVATNVDKEIDVVDYENSNELIPTFTNIIHKTELDEESFMEQEIDIDWENIKVEKIDIEENDLEQQIGTKAKRNTSSFEELLPKESDVENEDETASKPEETTFETSQDVHSQSGTESQRNSSVFEEIFIRQSDVNSDDEIVHKPEESMLEPSQDLHSQSCTTAKENTAIFEDIFMKQSDVNNDDKIINKPEESTFELAQDLHSQSGTKAERNSSILEEIINKGNDEDSDDSPDSKIVFDESFHDEIVSKLEESKFELSQELHDKLLETHIAITWSVPPTHSIKLSISKGPGLEKRDHLIKIYGAKFGYFTKKEDEIIKSNWEDFSHIYEFDDPKPFVNFKSLRSCFNSSKRVKFLQFIGRGLDNRILFSINCRFKKLCTQVIRGKFSKDECELLRYYSEEKRLGNLKNQDLGKILNRAGYNISRKIKELRGEKVSNIIWDRYNLEKFIKLLIETTKVPSYEALKNMDIPGDVWKKMGDIYDMKPSKLKRKWLFSLHMQLFATEPINMNSVHKVTIEKLHELQVSDWKAFNWGTIANEIEGATNLFISNNFHHLVQRHVPVEMQTDFGEAVKFLYKNLGMIKTYNIKLKRYSFENGTLLAISNRTTNSCN